MPEITLRITDLSVTFEVPSDFAADITKEDLHEMVSSALGVHQAGKGVQTIVKSVAQWTDMGPEYAKSDPVFSDVSVQSIWEEECEVDSCDDEFTSLLDENPDICA